MLVHAHTHHKLKLSRAAAHFTHRTYAENMCLRAKFSCYCYDEFVAVCGKLRRPKEKFRFASVLGLVELSPDESSHQVWMSLCDTTTDCETF